MPLSKYDEATKRKIIGEKSKKNVDEICKDYKISKQTFFKWQRDLGKGKRTKGNVTKLNVSDIKAKIQALKMELAEAVLSA